ncbi:MAG: flagellar M-ring protein FliF [Gammaproteobacteria bacterium]|nr:flagellar M-ring protein FliF [Gammaproteobacteria bacterium]
MTVVGFLYDMSPGRRVGLGLGVLLILALMLWVSLWLASDRYAVLFSGVNQRDAAGILAELDRMKVDYRLEQGGSQIMVADTLVHETRLKLMGSDTPLSGGVGFEVFDNSDFGMTEFAQKINFQRALQGELTRTILSLRSVKYARVHLVMQERGLFQQDDNPPSASVTLFLQPGQTLDKSQVLGIQQLVAASVPNLNSRQVTVSDRDGLTLSAVTDSGEMQVISGRLQQKESVELYLAGKLYDVLNRAFGPKQAMASVDVKINFDRIKTTRENITPLAKGSNSVLRRRESIHASDAKQSKNGNTTTEIEYLHGRTIAEIVETPGSIERINVGIMVPADAEPARIEEVRELVAVTVGLDFARGDAIAVYPVSPLKGQVGALEETGIFVAEAISMDSARNQDGELASMPQLDSLVAMLKQHPPLFGGIVVTLLLLLLITLLLGRRGDASKGGVSLTDEQRQQLLTDLQVWLMADKELNHEEKARNA